MVSIVSAARDIARVREVSSVLVRHGFGEAAGRLGLLGKRSRSDAPTEDSPKKSGRLPVPERLRQVLEDLGPSFVKLGQIASTRPDLLPRDLIVELKKLQDELPPLPFERIQEQVELSLGAPIDEIFIDFEREPLAAASIAQVHRAKLNTEAGLMTVAVKVQRPGIAATIASDLDILHSLAALLERAIPETKIYSPVGLVQQFDHAITAELDFTSEADNARRFAKNFDADPQIQFPRIFREASSRNVVTMEFISGHKIDEAIKQGHSGPQIARLAFRSMIQQIYEDGFFHADPHPGNVLVGSSVDGPVLTFIDLGMVGRLSPRMRDLTIDVVTASLRQDYDGIADALYAIGTPTKKINMDAYRAEVGLLSERYLGKQLADLEISALIGDLVRAATKYGLEIPTDFVLMGKALMTIEGIGKEIDPAFDVYEEARPLFTELLKKRYSPERMGGEFLKRIERFGGASYKVPQRLEEVLDDLRLGRLALDVRDPLRTAAVAQLGRRLQTALLSGSLILGGAGLLALHRDTYGLTLLGLSAIPIIAYQLSELWRMLRRR